jgi:hypothetical protein
MNGIFAKLQEPDFFRTYVIEHFERAPAAVIEHFPCKNTVAQDRVTFAYDKYKNNIQTYSVLLHSENPDHYKRSGALLHALYRSKIVTKIEYFDGEYGSKDDMEQGFCLQISYAQAQEQIAFPKFYDEYHNHLLSFDLAYKCCVAYEDHLPSGYTFEYLYNMCHYLWKNEDLTQDSCSMIFRSLMHPV